MQKTVPEMESPYMTMRQVAQFFCVSETSVYRSRGDFGKLRRVTTGGRTLFIRADVMALDKELQARAIAPTTRGIEAFEKYAKRS